MLVKDLTTRVVCCTPWDTAQAAARLMKAYGVGAIAEVADPSDPLLEGIATDRDLCRGVVAAGKNADAVQVADLMSAILVTCGPEETVDECLDLMQENQVRRILVVNTRGRCIGIVWLKRTSHFMLLLRKSQAQSRNSKPTKQRQEMHCKKDYFYCGQPHELDQILLLKRRRESTRRREVLL